MKRLLGLILLGALIYGGYYLYNNYSNKNQASSSPLVSNHMKITQSNNSFDDFTKVLGASTSRIWDSGLKILNGATDGQAEPVINKAVSDLQNQIKSLPREQYEKVKYEFCKDVVTSYEEKK